MASVVIIGTVTEEDGYTVHFGNSGGDCWLPKRLIISRSVVSEATGECVIELPDDYAPAQIVAMVDASIQ